MLPLVGTQGVALAAGGVEGQHQLAPTPLPERFGRSPPLPGRPPTRGDRRARDGPGRGSPRLFGAAPADGSPRPRRGHCRPDPPEGNPATRNARFSVSTLTSEVLPGARILCDNRFETQGVDLIGVEVEAVAAVNRYQHPGRQHLAQARCVGLHRA